MAVGRGAAHHSDFTKTVCNPVGTFVLQGRQTSRPGVGPTRGSSAARRYGSFAAYTPARSPWFRLLPQPETVPADRRRLAPSPNVRRPRPDGSSRASVSRKGRAQLAQASAGRTSTSGEPAADKRWDGRRLLLEDGVGQRRPGTSNYLAGPGRRSRLSTPNRLPKCGGLRFADPGPAAMFVEGNPMHSETPAPESPEASTTDGQQPPQVPPEPTAPRKFGKLRKAAGFVLDVASRPS